MIVRHKGARVIAPTCITLFLWLSAAAWAQVLTTVHSVRGLVQDPQGHPVEGASVALYQEGSSTLLARTATKSGRFEFHVASARYLLEISANGFRRMTVLASNAAPVEVRLEVAGLDQHVFVTAEASAQTIDQVSKAATVLDAAEIAQRNEYSLSETLRGTPGVLVRNLGGPGQATSVFIRGLRADATAVLIDGLRFRDPSTTQGDASSYLSTFNVINFDRVEVLRGSGSSLYGTNAVGGTVNVVTDPGGGPVHGGLQVEGGQLGLIRGRGTIAGGLLGNRLTYSGGLLHLNVLSGVDGNDRTRSTGLQTFTRYVLTPRVSVSGRVFFSDDFVQPNRSPTTSGIPQANIPATGIVPAIPLPGSQIRNLLAGRAIDAGSATFIPSTDDPDYRRSSRFWTGAFMVRADLSRTLTWQSSYQRVHTSRTFSNGPVGIGFQPEGRDVSVFDGDIDTIDSRVNWRPSSWYSLTGGYEFERESYLTRDANNLPAPETLATRTTAQQRSQAAYFAQQFEFLQHRWQVSASGRVQTFGLDRPRFIYTGVANNYDLLPLSAPPRALTGDVATSYFLPRTSTKLRAHGGNSYRAPSLYERFGSGFYYDSYNKGVAFTPYGDPRLEPDRYNSVDAGVDQYLWKDRIRVSATWFYTRIVRVTAFDFSNNAVKYETDPFGRYSGYYNGSGGVSRGVETTAEARPMRGTLIRASYWYVNSGTDRDTAVPGFYRALGIPPHAFSGFIHQQIGRKNDVTIDVYQSSDYYGGLYTNSGSRAYRFSGFTKLDAVGNRDLWKGESATLRGYVKVDNLLNQRYFENGFTAPGATFLTGVQVQFR